MCMSREEREPQDGAGEGVVPLVEACPACGGAIEGQRCKVYCTNEGCILYRRIIENCAGD